jgi:hypothetical protein
MSLKGRLPLDTGMPSRKQQTYQIHQFCPESEPITFACNGKSPLQGRADREVADA